MAATMDKREWLALAASRGKAAAPPAEKDGAAAATPRPSGPDGAGRSEPGGQPGSAQDDVIVAVLVSNKSRDKQASPPQEAADASSPPSKPGGSADFQQDLSEDETAPGGGAGGQGLLTPVSYQSGGRSSRPPAPRPGGGQRGGAGASSPRAPMARGGGGGLDTAQKAVDLADKAVDVADKLVTLGERTVTILRDNTSVEVPRNSRRAVLPQGAALRDLSDGELGGPVTYKYERSIFGLKKVNVVLSVEWQSNCTYKGHGQYIKNAVVNVQAEVLFPHHVTVTVDFGEPAAGSSPMLPIEIRVHDRGAVNDSIRTFSGIIKGSGGYVERSVGQ